MPNQIIPVVWEKPLRKSAVNTLDKLNEVIDFINTSDIHEFSFIDGDTGREVVSGTSTQLATLDVFGECVQDGTPTPENPVPVQVVNGINVWDEQWEVGGINSVNGENVTDNAKFRSKNYIPMLNNIYYFRCGTNDTLGIRFYNANKDFINSSAITTNNVVNLRNLSQNAAYFRFVDTSQNTYAEDICINVSNPDINGLYLPYGSIGLHVGETVTPIDLQGHVLASLPDGTQDELDIDAAGVVSITQRVGVVDLGTLTWAYSGTNASDIYRMESRDISNVVAKPASGGVINNLVCERYVPQSADRSYTRNFGVALNTAGFIEVYDPEYNTSSSPAAFKTAMQGVMLYYELATPQTIELGTITPPPIPSGSVIKIAATLEPEFDIQWWTESAIPSVINGLKAYVDEQIETVNARIDELHGITRATVVRPDASIPAIEFEPIEKITVDETETDTEKEI